MILTTGARFVTAAMSPTECGSIQDFTVSSSLSEIAALDHSMPRGGLSYDNGKLFDLVRYQWKAVPLVDESPPIGASGRPAEVIRFTADLDDQRRHKRFGDKSS